MPCPIYSSALAQATLRLPLDQSGTGRYPFLRSTSDTQKDEVPIHTPSAFQRCISPACGATYDVGEVRVACGRCGGLLDVAYDWSRDRPAAVLEGF